MARRTPANVHFPGIHEGTICDVIYLTDSSEDEDTPLHSFPPVRDPPELKSQSSSAGAPAVARTTPGSPEGHGVDPPEYRDEGRSAQPAGEEASVPVERPGRRTGPIHPHDLERAPDCNPQDSDHLLCLQQPEERAWLRPPTKTTSGTRDSLRRKAPTLTCQTCRNKFPANARAKYRYHFSLQHAKKSYILVCPFCPLFYVFKGQLYRHVTETHKDKLAEFRAFSTSEKTEDNKALLWEVTQKSRRRTPYEYIQFTKCQKCKGNTLEGILHSCTPVKVGTNAGSARRTERGPPTPGLRTLRSTSSEETHSTPTAKEKTTNAAHKNKKGRANPKQMTKEVASVHHPCDLETDFSFPADISDSLLCLKDQSNGIPTPSKNFISNNKVVCPACKTKKLGNMSQFREHYSLCHAEKAFILVCAFCPVFFVRRRDLGAHVKKAHERRIPELGLHDHISNKSFLHSLSQLSRKRTPNVYTACTRCKSCGSNTLKGIYHTCNPEKDINFRPFKGNCPTTLSKGCQNRKLVRSPNNEDGVEPCSTGKDMPPDFQANVMADYCERENGDVALPCGPDVRTVSHPSQEPQKPRISMDQDVLAVPRKRKRQSLIVSVDRSPETDCIGLNDQQGSSDPAQSGKENPTSQCEHGSHDDQTPVPCVDQIPSGNRNTGTQPLKHNQDRAETNHSDDARDQQIISNLSSRLLIAEEALQLYRRSESRNTAEGASRAETVEDLSNRVRMLEQALGLPMVKPEGHSQHINISIVNFPDA